MKVSDENQTPRLTNAPFVEPRQIVKQNVQCSKDSAALKLRDAPERFRSQNGSTILFSQRFAFVDFLVACLRISHSFHRGFVQRDASITI